MTERRAPDRQADARAAFDAGRAAADPAERRRWLERAHRLLPGDPTLRLALAEAKLGHDDAGAEALLRSLASRHDRREVWWALAAARLAEGNARGAAEALVRALSGHAMPPGLDPLADAIAVAAGAPGWCGFGADGAKLFGPASASFANEADLLGAPLSPEMLTRVEGFVEAAPGGGLRGWAWHPGNPDLDPTLRVIGAHGPELTVRAEIAEPATDGGLLSRRRRFSVPYAALAGAAGPFRVVGADDRDLLGSPVAIGAPPSLTPSRAERGSRVAPSPPRAGGGRGKGKPPGIDVIVAVHGGREATLACLASVFASTTAPSRLIVVDDATPERGLAEDLDALAGIGRIVLIRHARTGGFPAAANAGLRLAAASGCDAVLLNSDTLVPPGWLALLREAAYGAPDIGTVTPLSNNAGIVSHPGPDGTNPEPDLRATRDLAALARRANGARVVDIPVGVGFCLYVRADCLRATGLLRADLFAQGYGEENDFCLRASRLGWRNVAAPGLFVAHLGGQSFGGAGPALRARNGAILERLHPGYSDLIARHVALDPLAAARRRIDMLGFRAGRRERAVLIVTHDQGGGVERAIGLRAALIRRAGRRPLVLRPARLADGRSGAQLAEAGEDAAFPNLVFAIPGEAAKLRRVLAAEGLERMELHHLLGHAPEMLEALVSPQAAYEVHVHDSAWFCPRVVLLGAAGRYCEEPDLAGCVSCVSRGGSLIDEPTDPAALRARSLRVLAGARRVVVPSRDAATRIARHFPTVAPSIVPHEDDAALPPPPPSRTGSGRIAVIGAIGVAKGYDVLLACARDAERRRLPLDFVVVGHTIDDARLLATGRVFVTGPFAPDEAGALIRAQDAAVAFIPSVVPEAWCFALTDAWRAGLRAVVFDLGAQAERVRATGFGQTLALRSKPATINDALLAASGIWHHEDVQQDLAETGS